MKKILLLVWKNLILRKRHYIVTILEILCPVFAVLIVGYIKSRSGTSGSSFVFSTVEEPELKLKASEALFCATCTIAYTPDNVETRDVIHHLKSCLPGANTTAWKPFHSEQDIETHVAHLSSNISLSNSFRVAIVFEDGLGLGVGATDGIVSYKIRLLKVEASSSSSSSNFQLLFPTYQEPGSDSENAKRYIDSGFIGLQLCIDKTLLERLTGVPVNHDISVQPFPYPAYHSTNFFNNIYFSSLPSAFVFGFIFIVPSITRVVVSEKETGIRELLKLNGLSGWMQWLGWMITSILIHIVSVTLVLAIIYSDMMEKKSVKRNGPLFEYTDFSIWWCVLMLYIISASSFSMFICSFFTSPSLATTLGLVLWVGPFKNRDFETYSLLYKVTSALHPNNALMLATRIISSFEEKEKGIQWSNIGEPVSKDDPLSVAHIILLFTLNILLYTVFTLYLENVLPSKFGVRKPWYYVFLLSTYYSNHKVEPVNDQFYANQNSNGRNFEDGPPNSKIGVDIRNLRKDFGKGMVAVEGLNMRLFEGEIFVLLGHNGAGKTTTISMLTGMFAPSGGTAVINGYDITKALDRARDNLGLCPQHNMLFDEMTVLEHLIFFGQLKGLKCSCCAFPLSLCDPAQASNDEIDEVLQKLSLDDEWKTLTKNLSGGQKRKLSLGIAIIGKTKVAILDEPTSGMDPEARREIWDLLQELRDDERTILITTHLMEEADVLGDRVGIMNSGKLQCCGSPMFLKHFYGAGYTLKLCFVEESKSQQDDMLPLIQNYVPNASLKEGHHHHFTPERDSMLINLPTDTASSSTLAEMFTELNARKEELGITTIGLALTTMDQVFLRVGELADNEHRNTPTPVQLENKEKNDDDEEAQNKSPKIRSKTVKLVGFKLVMAQFLALLTKKYVYTYRNWRLIITQLIIPILLLSFVIGLNNSFLSTPDPPPPLQLSLDSYKTPITLATSSDPAISSQLSNVIGPSFKQVSTGTPILDALFSAGESHLADYRTTYIIAIEATSTKLNALFNTIPNHAAPLALNVASNLLLKTLDPAKNLNIRVTNHPLDSKLSTFLAAARPNSIESLPHQQIAFSFGFFMPLALAILATNFIIFPTEEKIGKIKQLQMITGVSPLTYWYSTFLWDFLQAILLFCVMMLCFLIFQNHDFFTSNGGGIAIFLILVVYGYAAIPFSYLFSLCASSVAGGFGQLCLINVASGMILTLIDLDDINPIAAVIFRWFGRLFPTFGASMAIKRFAEIATKNGRCNSLSDEAKDLICDPALNISPELRQCCENCKMLAGVTCFTPRPYLTWSYDKGNGTLVPGIGEELVVIVSMALLYQLILILYEYEVFHWIFSSLRTLALKVLRRNKNSLFANDLLWDQDVRAEVERVADMVENDKIHEDALVVENFCKSYGTFAAVSKLSFGVHYGECFGLLGVNGAGKTTTFGMLTGDTKRSLGNAYGFGNSLDRNRKEFLSNIGYCPQFDGVMGVLSGRQMVELFSRLRGVPSSIGRDENNKWLGKMGLLENANLQCQKYSGGMKRRLSVAMAMIGDPPLLLLDEPTSGVDPVSRHQFWDVLNLVRDSGQSIILTSHSMDECEALCSRVGIMVNGQLQCLGEVQHLKSKFAQGYTLSIKLKPLVTPESRLACVSMRNAIAEKFAPCMLKDKHQNVLQYRLLSTALEWDELFKTMEDFKMTYEDMIEDYSLNETSLEEVFLSFARKQKEYRMPGKKKKKKKRKLLIMPMIPFFEKW